MTKRLKEDFYTKSALEVAPLLLGKILVRKLSDGTLLKYRITETEIYYGEEDSACHARFGKTARNAIMYEKGGLAYVYICYGIHFLLNIITGPKDHPEGVLIRGIENYTGPGKLTKVMQIDKELNGTNLITSDLLWIEDDGIIVDYVTAPRIGIDYASEPYKSIEWRFIMKKS